MRVLTARTRPALRWPAGLLAVLAAATLGPAPFTTAPAYAVPTCHGRPATIVATTDRAVVQGTAGDDVVVARASVNVVAGAGNDLVCADGLGERDGLQVDLGTGRDRFYGGDESDFVTDTSDDGHDTIRTGRGADGAYLAGGNVAIDLGLDRDYVDYFPVRGSRPSTIDLGRGENDVLHTEVSFTLRVDLARHRVVENGVTSTLTGTEHVSAVAHRAVLTGDGKSNVFGIAGCEVELSGGAGDDQLLIRSRGNTSPGPCDQHRLLLVGGPGNDELKGSSGDDTLLGGPGSDYAFGAGGTDRCVAETRRACER